MAKTGKGGPSDPRAIMLARIAERVRARRDAAEAMGEDLRLGHNPVDWGIDPTIGALATSADIAAIHDPHRPGRIVHAKRGTAFDLVSLSGAQHAASRRYTIDWAVSAGVSSLAIDEPKDDGRDRPAPIDAGPGLAPGQHITQRMVDAGARIAEAHKGAGPASARLLAALVEPLVMHGQVLPWRDQVKAVTGESERHAQAAAVRQACENLQLAYVAIDEEKARLRRRFAGGAAAA